MSEMYEWCKPMSRSLFSSRTSSEVSNLKISKLELIVIIYVCCSDQCETANPRMRLLSPLMGRMTIHTNNHRLTLLSISTNNRRLTIPSQLSLPLSLFFQSRVRSRFQFFPFLGQIIICLLKILLVQV